MLLRTSSGDSLLPPCPDLIVQLALAKSPLAEMKAWTDGQYPSRLCNVYIKLQDGDKTTLPRPFDG